MAVVKDTSPPASEPERVDKVFWAVEVAVDTAITPALTVVTKLLKTLALLLRLFWAVAELERLVLTDPDKLAT